MRIAIDLDGTIGAYPVVFRLINEVLRAKHTTIVVTAAAGELPKAQRPEEVKRRLARLEFVPDEIVCLESSEKAAWVLRNGIDLFIDDDPGIIAQVRSKSKILCLLVAP